MNSSSASPVAIHSLMRSVEPSDKAVAVKGGVLDPLADDNHQMSLDRKTLL